MIPFGTPNPGDKLTVWVVGEDALNSLNRTVSNFTSSAPLFVKLSSSTWAVDVKEEKSEKRDRYLMLDNAINRI